MRHHGYTSDPPLPEVQTANRQFAEAKKERKDVEKQRRDRKRRDKEEREKANREWVKEGKSPLPLPETTPEPDSSPSGSGNVDYLMWPDPDMEGARGQSPGQRRAGAKTPAPVDEKAHARTSGERSPTWFDVETLGQVSPLRHQVGPSAAPVGRSTGTGGSARAPRSGSKKRKLGTTSG